MCGDRCIRAAVIRNKDFHQLILFCILAPKFSLSNEKIILYQRLR